MRLPLEQANPPATNLDDKAWLLRRGALDVLPLALAVMPWGVLCGSLAINAGLTAIQAQCLSLLVFAGAVQLASVTIVAAGGPPFSILTSSAVISSRHLLYSAVLRADVKALPALWRYALAFVLTDEMFAVVVGFKSRHGRFSPHHALSAGVVFYLLWNLATLAGIVAGQWLPNLQELGLEFAIAATFIAIVIPTVKTVPSLAAVLTSGTAILMCELGGIKHGLIIATLAGMTAGYVASMVNGSKT